MSVHTKIPRWVWGRHCTCRIYKRNKGDSASQILAPRFSSVAQSCPTLCNPMDCSTPGFSVHHQLLEPTQICPSCQWCHPTISFSVVPFSSCLQSFPASGSFPMSQFFASCGQGIGVSASASFLPMNTRTDLPSDGLVGSPCSPRDFQESSPIPQFKNINSLCSAFFIIQLSHPYMTIGKTIALEGPL